MIQIERAALKHLHYHLYNRQLVGSRRITQEAQPALNPWRGGMRWGWEAGSRGRRHISLRADSCYCMAKTSIML